MKPRIEVPRAQTEAARLNRAVGAPLAAAGQAVHQAATGLKLDLRAMVQGAGLGSRLARTWQQSKTKVKTYASAFVYSKAPKVMRGFDEGGTFRAANATYLALPGPGCPVKVGGGRRPTPKRIEEMYGEKLRMVRSRSGKRFLVMDLRASASKTDRIKITRGFRRRTDRQKETGRGGVTLVMFFLVPSVRLRKRFDVETVARRWAGRIPGLLQARWRAFSKTDFIAIDGGRFDG